jgi:hypothetical protein
MSSQRITRSQTRTLQVDTQEVCNLENTDTTVLCPECDKSFNTAQGFKVHYGLMHRAKSDDCEWCAKCQCCEGKRANVKSVKPNGTRRFRNRETFEKHRWACKRKHIFNGDPSLKQPNQTSEIQDPQLSDEHHNDIGTAGIEVSFTPVQHSAEVEQGMVRKPPLNFPTASDDAKWEIIDTQTFEDLQEVYDKKHGNQQVGAHLGRSCVQFTEETLRNAEETGESLSMVSQRPSVETGSQAKETKVYPEKEIQGDGKR